MNELKNIYRFEYNRLKSFKNWPNALIDIKRLANAGFYYINIEDKVKCFECLVELYRWEAHDNPTLDHLRYSKRCKFINNIPCGNVPLDVPPKKKKRPHSI